MNLCGKCGMTIDDGAAFCPRCGNPVAVYAPNCPRCGMRIDAGSGFCRNCGTPVAANCAAYAAPQYGVPQYAVPPPQMPGSRGSIGMFTALKKYAVFSGRATRSEYWLFMLLQWIITLILGACVVLLYLWHASGDAPDWCTVHESGSHKSYFRHKPSESELLSSRDKIEYDRYKRRWVVTHKYYYKYFNPVITYTFVALYLIFALVFFIPGLAVNVRRLHDTGRPGAFLLFVLIPFGWLILFIFALLPSEPRDNMYGPYLA